jgi:hypothetical protein
MKKIEKLRLKTKLNNLSKALDLVSKYDNLGHIEDLILDEIQSVAIEIDQDADVRDLISEAL